MDKLAEVTTDEGLKSAINDPPVRERGNPLTMRERTPWAPSQNNGPPRSAGLGRA